MFPTGLKIIILFYPQSALLLCCDWQLDARTQLWQRETSSSNKTAYPNQDSQPLPPCVSSRYLNAFQRDLRVLKRLSRSLGSNGGSARVPLREATARMMAGAAPAKTQLLIDQTLMQKAQGKTLICNRGD